MTEFIEPGRVASLHDPASDETSQEALNLSLVNHPVKPTSTIRTLPVEILIEIFTLVLARNHATVVALAQICQDVRHIVVSTPSLWSSLSLSSNNPLEKAALWISRNQGLLRALYIREWYDDVTKALKSLSNVPLDKLCTLFVASYDLCELKICLPSLTPETLSRLESLTFRYIKLDPGWFDGIPISQLRFLDARYTTLDWGQIVTKTTELRHLSYIEPLVAEPGPDILSLLQRNPYMRSLALHCHAWPKVPRDVSDSRLYPPPSLNSRLELAHLSGLTLASFNPDFLVPFVSLPNLRFLQLEHLASDLHWTEITRNLIEAQAANKLVSLAIIYVTPGWDVPIAEPELNFPRTLTELLRGASHLKYLELFMIPCIGDVLRALADDPQAHCPRLTSLDVSQCSDVDDELLMALVKARNDKVACIGRSNSSARTDLSTATVTKLHTLVVNSCCQVTGDAVRWLGEHVPHVTCHYNRRRRQRTERQRRLDAAYWRGL